MAQTFTSSTNGASRLMVGLGLGVLVHGRSRSGGANRRSQIRPIAFERGQRAIEVARKTGTPLELEVPQISGTQISVFEQGLSLYVVLVQPNGGVDFVEFTQNPPELDMGPVSIQRTAAMVPGEIERNFGPEGLPTSARTILDHFLEYLPE